MMIRPADEAKLLRKLLTDLFDNMLLLRRDGTVEYGIVNGNREEVLSGCRLSDVLEEDGCRWLMDLFDRPPSAGQARPVRLALRDGGCLEGAVLSPGTDSDQLVLLGGSLPESMLVVFEERREREKELKCLYRVGQAIEQEETVEDYFTGLPAILSAGFRFPSKTNVLVRFRDRAWGTPAPEGARRLVVPLVFSGEESGCITVWSEQEEDFLAQEHQLMAEVARVTVKAIEKYEQGIELEQSLRRLRSLLSSIPDRIVLMDTDYNVLATNHKGDEACGHRCHRFYYNRNTPCVDCPVSEALETRRSASRRWRSRRRSFLLTAYPVLSEEGKVEGVVEYVKETTQDDQVQQQLVQADKMASLGRLTAGVAHEINNPTQFIMENIRIVRESLEDALPVLEERHREQPELRIARLPFDFFRQQVPLLARDIETGAVRIRDIVASLKQFARQDEGRRDEVFSLKDAVETSLRLTHNQVKSTARVDLNMPDDLPRITGNVQQIEQVIVNIVINACEAIREDAERTEKGRIDIRAGVADKGGMLSLDISDNGPGIKPELVKRIFDPFFSTKKDVGGTGLGLSIVYGIIQEHGGSVDVDSRPGRGTEFRILLPLTGEANGQQHPGN